MPVSGSIVLNTISKVEKVQDKFVKQLEGTMRTLEKNLKKALDEARVTETIDIALARANIEKQLIESGYYKVTGELLDSGYQSVIEKSYEQYKKLYNESFQFSEVGLERINALKQVDGFTFSGFGQDATNKISKLMVDLQYGAVDYNKAIDILSDELLPSLQKFSETYINTSLAGVHREANTLLAEEAGIEKYEYIGPEDDITRPFCQDVLDQNKEWTINEIMDLDNGQGLNVRQFGGGYNCRHQWVGVK